MNAPVPLSRLPPEPSVTVQNRSARRNYSLLATPPSAPVVLYEVRGEQAACEEQGARTVQGELQEGNAKFGEDLRAHGASFLPPGPFCVLNGSQSSNGLPPILFELVIAAAGGWAVYSTLRGPTRSAAQSA